MTGSHQTHCFLEKYPHHTLRHANICWWLLSSQMWSGFLESGCGFQFEAAVRAMKCHLHCSSQTDAQHKSRPWSKCQQHHLDLARQFFIPLKSLAILPTVYLKEEEKCCPHLICRVSFCILMHTETIKNNCPSMHFPVVKLTNFFLSSKC